MKINKNEYKTEKSGIVDKYYLLNFNMCNNECLL